MYLAKVYITYKESILDPKGEAVKKAIHQLDYQSVASVRMGKYFEITVEENDRAEVERTIEAIADQLLANVTMESYRYEIEEA
ncbi:phosphoribosylformylglycinamidine synthase [Jeotgalibaca sp. PTS2502]|uniref:Phosphoribosylformylglycinamidine synthase subunit PurS n=2 Tax=Jeotgalibaca TaxID=1470540 RepID=A0A6G7KCB6_9LACT|nr:MULTISPECIES: phosphoribosylformylglycinamidine synthase subunit PurS [Jeotgalibaca]APZ48828.1 phosphoribosylformylglycinamidine synthase [Jeotgalibaca sp. PTS2502]QII82851.1 phosphoribosylformylglycinamidine synthase subunit PurS [Jeotgalibaca arthritidis]HJA91303.1 phosphoribosylformylglycinamidine synthase subunit PurS [Candidatus Jeotgalibaca merdavium]